MQLGESFLLSQRRASHEAGLLSLLAREPLASSLATAGPAAALLRAYMPLSLQLQLQRAWRMSTSGRRQSAHRWCRVFSSQSRLLLSMWSLSEVGGRHCAEQRPTPRLGKTAKRPPGSSNTVNRQGGGHFGEPVLSFTGIFLTKLKT